MTRTSLKKLKLILLTAGVTIAGMAGLSGEAKAGDYCREYTRTVYIGGRSQDAYGTACLQPDGSWMIVGEGLGNDISTDVNRVDYVIHDDRRDIVPPRVVYYERPPTVYYYRTQPPRPRTVWYNDGRFYRNGVYINIRDNDRRDYGWRDHDRGRGRGRDHHDNGWHRGWDRD